jgi:viroplasmin and RNaseH domain-containing protein
VSEYRFEDKLRNRAEEFIRKLAPAGFNAGIVEESFREYSVKVSVSAPAIALGYIVIYYRPRSNSFSMSAREIKDKSIAPLLEESWHGGRSTSNPQAAAAAYEIYADGSYLNGVTGYGAVILKDGKVIEELSGAVDASEVNGTNQVAGELAAVKESLKWCRAHSINEVSIYYDYLGIEKWATGRYKANQPLTQEYARFVRDCGIRIHWHKVTAHTGNRWNERADALAKKGTESAAPAGAAQDLVSELVRTTDAWIEFLMVKGIEASFDRIYNEQFARVVIIREDKPAGAFDLYNTKKKRFSPYLHNFRDDQLKAHLESLWSEFSGSRRD